MKKIILTLINNILTVCLFAQIGINTETPTSSLTIVAANAANPILNVENSDNKSLLRLDRNGYMGVGLASPMVKLDLRSTVFTDNNIIGIGTTAKSASEVGAGVLRYENSALQYSDGTQWITVSSNDIAKAYVLAYHSTPLVLVNGATSIIRNWTVQEQIGTGFNAALGVFTAPRNGVYSVSVTGVFSVSGSTVGSLGGVQLDIQTSNTVFPIGKSYVGNPPTIPNFNASVTNKTYIYLNAGEYAYVSCWFTAGGGSAMSMSSNPAFNVLTIAEM